MSRRPDGPSDVGPPDRWPPKRDDRGRGSRRWPADGRPGRSADRRLRHVRRAHRTFGGFEPWRAAPRTRPGSTARGGSEGQRQVASPPHGRTRASGRGRPDAGRLRAGPRRLRAARGAPAPPVARPPAVRRLRLRRRTTRFDGFEAGRHGKADMTAEIRMPDRDPRGTRAGRSVGDPRSVAHRRCPARRSAAPARSAATPPMAGSARRAGSYAADRPDPSDFQVRRFGSGYDPDQVDRLFEGMLGGMAGRGPMPVNPNDLDTLRFGLVPGGYFEAEVDAALKEVQDILLGADAATRDGPADRPSGRRSRGRSGRPCRDDRRPSAAASSVRSAGRCGAAPRRRSRRRAGARRCRSARYSRPLPSWLPNIIASSAAAVRTAPIRPALRFPGLCWSGDVTGSLPATFGPSSRSDLWLVWHVRPCGGVAASRPSARAQVARVGHYRRRGSGDPTPPVAFGRTPDCLGRRGTGGASDRYGARQHADRHRPRAASCATRGSIRPTSRRGSRSRTIHSWTGRPSATSTTCTSPTCTGTTSTRRTCKRLHSKKATVLLPEYPTSELEDELRELGFTSFLKTRNERGASSSTAA